MTFAYTWKITSLKKQDDPSAELDDIIVQTYWECKGIDVYGNAGTFSGATPFEPDMVDADNFTTYEDLTETQVLSWIQDVVNNNSGYKTHIDEQIQKQIDAIVRPMVDVASSALPWAEPGEEPVIPPTPIANT
jgi:hypothetical protein